MRVITVTLIALMISGCVSKSSLEKVQSDLGSEKRHVVELQDEYKQLEGDRDDLLTQRRELNEKLIVELEKNSKMSREILRNKANSARSQTGLERQQQKCQDELIASQETVQQRDENILQLYQEKQKLLTQLEKAKIAREARIAKIKSTYDQLVGKMEEEIERGEIQISDLEGQLQLNLLASILFDVGAAEVSTAGKKVLLRLGKILKKIDNKEIKIEGHTDNLEISNRLKDTYPTNWELSAARAINVVRFLKTEAGISGDRLVACGFGPYRPVASNKTAKGRAKNRRIQVVLAPLEPSNEK